MQKQRQEQAKDRIFSLSLLGCGLVFYLFFAIYDGAILCVDSPTYINMDLAREPLYSLFLAVLRGIFPAGGTYRGVPLYLEAAAIIQSLLAAVAAWSLTRFLQKALRLPKWASAVIFSIPLFVSLLCRFAAGRASMYSNSILTEGICLPLWLLFFRFLLEYCFSESGKRSARSLLICAVLSFLMISTRKQMLATLPLLVIAIVGVALRRKMRERAGSVRAGLVGLGKSVLACAAILLCVLLFDCTYNLAVRGEFVRHSSDDRFMATMAVYTARREDAQYIPDGKVRQLFLSIYDTCEAGGYLADSAGKGWLNRVTHFGDNYDHIQIDTLWPMARALANELESETVAQEFATDRICDLITGSLLPHTYPRILSVLLDNFLSGLVTTVAVRRPVFILYGILVYPLYLALAWLVWKKRGNRLVLAFSLLTLAGILVNVTAVSAVIFCQTRYTIYNMPLFYISLLLLLRETARILRKKAA